MAASTLRQRAPVVADVQHDGIDDLPNVLDAGLPAFTAPEFTIKDLLGAIPPECFERSAIKSGSYVVADFAMLGALVYGALHIDGNLGWNGSYLSGAAGFAAKWAAWAVYWVLSGWVATGVWVIAHECGHQAFSTSKKINDSVGLVLHSLLLVPYHSWRISHARHHAATGHMTRDEVFVPRTLAQLKERKTGRTKVVNNIEIEELLEDAPLYILWRVVRQQLFGWPAYIIANASGQTHYPAGTNHFNPDAIIFDKRHRSQVIVSDLGIAVVLAALTAAGMKWGFAALVKYYFVTYLSVNHYLVMITFLQHTDEILPHYRAGEWNFQRGALCTIDRNLLGPVGPYLFHGICETHISHHISSKIPHYRAWKATEALKAKLGEHYHFDNENMFVALFKQYRACRFVDEDGEVVFYRNSFGLAKRRVEYGSGTSDSGVDVKDSEE